MHPEPSALMRMSHSLQACTRGELTAAALSRQWREDAASLHLPDRYHTVLAELLDRLEASALFSEESCSFSQKDLLDGLQLWISKASASLKS